MALDQEFKAKWVAALRSGEYEQGKGALRTVLNEFCCLGVACDVYDSTRWATGSDMAVYRHTVNSAAVMPGSLAEELGLEGNYPGIGEIYLPDSMCPRDAGSAFIALTELNDEGFTFDQIADLIDYFL